MGVGVDVFLDLIVCSVLVVGYGSNFLVWNSNWKSDVWVCEGMDNVGCCVVDFYIGYVLVF